MALPSEERRRHIRIFMPGGQVRIMSGMLLALAGKVIEFSAGGVRFLCTANMNINDEIDLEVTLPSGKKFKCISRIIHFERSATNETQVVYGAQFLSLNAADQRELDEFIMKTRSEQDQFLRQKYT